MKYWAAALDIQRLQNTTPRASQTVDREQFAWMNVQQNNIENPYARQQQQDEEESDDLPASAPAAPFMAYHPPPTSALARNASAMNLRQRSMTGESTQSLASVARGPPPRFPIPMPTPLSLQTSVGSSASPPGPRNADSYFSPVVESPPSSRISTTSGFFTGPQAAYTFPRAPVPAGNSWEDNNNRYTAPALPRAPSRDGPASAQYGMNGRQPRGPSFPVSPPKAQSAAQLQRSRSYSTADINGLPAPRRNTQGAPTPAVPGIPAYVHDIPRSQTASPRAELPVRTNTQSPGAQRERMHQHTGSIGGTMAHFPTHPMHRQLSPNPPHGPQDPQQQQQQQMGHQQHHSISRTVSPALGVGPAHHASLMTQSNYPNHSNYSNPPSSPDASSPSQLKVRVTCDSGACCTLVVFNSITYQSLIDRIDAKLARFTPASLSRGSLKLRYQDEDGDYVTIESDDDIQIAFQEWKDITRGLPAGDAGEIQLYCFGDIA
jgi:cell division control protein 24